jgi:hypothetical protein
MEKYWNFAAALLTFVAAVFWFRSAYEELPAIAIGGTAHGINFGSIRSSRCASTHHSAACGH